MEAHDASRTTGERVVDWLVAKIGTLRFLVVQTILIAIWILLRAGFKVPIDNSGLTILNLALSWEAATAMILLLLAGNRQAAKDRALASHDYAVNDEALSLVREARQMVDDLHRGKAPPKAPRKIARPKAPK
jgi:uncharacterized membrane protein